MSKKDGAEDGARKTPSGIPPAESSARLRPPTGERRDPTPLRVLNGGGEPEGEARASDREAVLPEKPPGLKNMTTSARLRLQLAFDDEEEGAPKKPVGLKNMTPSARRRLELAVEHDESIRPPKLEGRHSAPEIEGKRRKSRPSLPGRIPFDAEALATVRSLSRWVAFCGFITLAVGALTGLSYLTGPGSVAHVVVGILATALSVWLLAAGWRFHRVSRDARRQHHLVSGLGLVRTAMLLKAILVFSAMVIGCFTFSIAVSLLLLL